MVQVLSSDPMLAASPKNPANRSQNGIAYSRVAHEPTEEARELGVAFGNKLGQGGLVGEVHAQQLEHGLGQSGAVFGDELKAVALGGQMVLADQLVEFLLLLGSERQGLLRRLRNKSM